MVERDAEPEAGTSAARAKEALGFADLRVTRDNANFPKPWYCGASTYRFARAAKRVYRPATTTLKEADMDDDGHGTWHAWSEFPAGDLKAAIDAAWHQVQHPQGTHWAVQIHGTNPISGYRVRTPLAQAQDAPPPSD